MPTKASALTWDTTQALNLARLAHYGQPDKGGEPGNGDYIHHPVAVREIVAQRYADRFEAPDGTFDRYAYEVAQQVALLHDVIEDTPFTAAMLLELGVPEPVVTRVAILSHRPDEEYPDYMQRLHEEGDFIVRTVKDADMDHNTDESRLAKLAPEKAQRFRDKYTRGRAILHGA